MTTVDAPTTPAAANAARLVDQCPACGYSLEGLPDVGVCPECGGRYDQTMIVLHGTACGQFANLANGSRRRLAWQAGIVLLMLYEFGHTALGARDPVLLIMFVIGVVITLMSLARRLLVARPGLVQVYLRPDGFLQRDHDDRTLLYVLNKVAVFVAAIAILSLAVTQVRSAAARAFGMVGMGLAGAIVVGAVAYHLVAHRPDRPPSPVQVFKLWRRSWREPRLLRLEPAGDGRFRLQLFETGGWGGSPHYYADADVACTPEQAARLRTLIDGWMSTGRRPRQEPGTDRDSKR